MADVFKFRVTVDLEVATHEHPKKVRDGMKEQVEEWLTEQLNLPVTLTMDSGGIIDRILAFNVRTKRLDDYAEIGPPVKLTVADLTCPHCASNFKNVMIHQLPFRCPVCNKTVPLDAEGKVRE